MNRRTPAHVETIRKTNRYRDLAAEGARRILLRCHGHRVIVFVCSSVILVLDSFQQIDFLNCLIYFNMAI